MYFFVEKSMRSGLSYISKKYSKASTKYLQSYGYASSKFFPTNGFKWIVLDSNKCSSKGSKGCVLKVDLEYPKELNELHNDYTLAPDKTKI